MLCRGKKSLSKWIRNATDRRYLYHGLANYEERRNTGVCKKQEAGGSVESDIKDVGNHLFRGRNQRNSMSYVVTIFTEKHLYRVNIEEGTKYTIGSGEKRCISDVRAWQ